MDFSQWQNPAEQICRTALLQRVRTSCQSLQFSLLGILLQEWLDWQAPVRWCSLTSKCIFDTLQISLHTNPTIPKLSNQQIALLAVARAVRMALPMQRQNPFSPSAHSASNSWAGAALGTLPFPPVPQENQELPAPTASMNLGTSFSSSRILAPDKDATPPSTPYKQQSPFTGIFLKI